jgi:hypothetical protein
MSTSPQQPQAPTTTAKSMASTEDMIAALEALVPDPDTLRAIRFGQLFPIIVRKKAENCSDQQILNCLAKLGLLLHTKTYAKLFNAELKARNELGERVCCVTCGQPLHVKEQRPAEESTSLVDTTDIHTEVVL